MCVLHSKAIILIYAYIKVDLFMKNSLHDIFTFISYCHVLTILSSIHEKGGRFKVHLLPIFFWYYDNVVSGTNDRCERFISSHLSRGGLLILEDDWPHYKKIKGMVFSATRRIIFGLI